MIASPMTAPAKRDLVSIEDLSTAEILELFEHADRYRSDLRAWSDVGRGSIMATLFFEPSTRTRLSFESAMHRLGGGVITAADIQTLTTPLRSSTGHAFRSEPAGGASPVSVRPR